MVHGTCRADFEQVREAFERNFEGGDLGATAAVTLHGELIVDLWGGYRDVARTLAWESDTLVNVWSSTKMVSALCMLILHDRGELSVDAPVAHYWPEFAANGKEGVLVRHILGHTAGLHEFEDTPDDVEVFDLELCCSRLAAQAPAWPPGEGMGYHAETQGFLLGEIVRRVDGRTLGTFFRDEVAGPLGIDFYVGLPRSEHGRVADLSVFGASAERASPRATLASRRSLGLANTSAWRAAEFPASNGHGNARALAKTMAVIANGGSLGDTTLLSPETVERIFEVQAEGVDQTLGTTFKLGLGYGLNCAATPLGTNDRTCWWGGWGGAMTVVDVENSMTVSYAMNQMRGDVDMRGAGIVFAAHGALGAADS